MTASASRTRTIVLALALDAACGDPPNAIHPVAWVGQAIASLNHRHPEQGMAQILYGAGQTALLVGGAAVAGWLVQRGLGRLPGPLAQAAEAALLKATLSVRMLGEAANRVEAALEAGDQELARDEVRALVSRDPSTLDETQLASAAIESVAENLADSVIAPLLAYAIGGLPAAFAYRVANTLDAMIGYRGEYEYVGKVAARFDDALNFIPSRLAGCLIVAASALAGGDVAGAWSIMRRDAGRTASPNAGWPMSAMAGALGLRLEKPGHYVLGDPLPRPDLPAIDQSVQIMVSATVLGALVAIALARWQAPRGR